ncbi:hypothetical protein GQ43DRAFT_483033 [Delitschia confertaspora ATCC 74209]|uniref:BZIP domain-containing protein n=1 Tax=Delitschia confertaspora ATCC 74209 TaxID=1513339 RepID=A0A9P4JG04_9PLEO|nr:hypothetical protein GQ43DRAFT_483033 [Delitschia confertaspora ATCC 74209]
MAETKESSTDKDSPAYLKRREQVRKAQRTHRERKEAYIKSLENEVIQLRTNEARILQENRALYARIGRLANINDAHGITYGTALHSSAPTQMDINSPQPSEPSGINIRQNIHHQRRTELQNYFAMPSPDLCLSESDGSVPSAPCNRGFENCLRGRTSLFDSGRDRSVSGSNGDNCSTYTESLSVPSPNIDMSGGLSTPKSSPIMRDVDETDIGVELHLTQGLPCLSTHPSPQSPHLSASHSFTTTTPFLYQSPLQHARPQDNLHKPCTSNSTPDLNLKKFLPPSGQPTPVQAWHRSHNPPEFDSLDDRRLKELNRWLREWQEKGYDDSSFAGVC